MPSDLPNNLRHGVQTVPSTDRADTTPSQAPDVAAGERVRHTRTGTVWFGLCSAALLFVVLIVFMLQNTGSVRISFLWMSGDLPLSMALLVAAIGATILTMAAGTARIMQLRRSTRRHR